MRQLSWRRRRLAGSVGFQDVDSLLLLRRAAFLCDGA